MNKLPKALLYTGLTLVSGNTIAGNVNIGNNNPNEVKTEQNDTLRITYDIDQINTELKEELRRINDLISNLLQGNNQTTEEEIKIAKIIKGKIEDLQVKVLEVIMSKKIIENFPINWNNNSNIEEKINNEHQKILKALNAFEETHNS